MRKLKPEILALFVVAVILAAGIVFDRDNIRGVDGVILYFLAIIAIQTKRLMGGWKERE